MKLQTLLAIIQLSILGALCSSCSTAKPTIRHTVFFKLKHAEGSEKEAFFLSSAQELKKIDTVKNFKVLQETSPKNLYTFGLTMDFISQNDYDFYNKHPDHVKFVNDLWIPEVSDFVEIDHLLN